MLDRKYLVPEIHEERDLGLEKSEDSDEARNPVETCLEKLEVVRSAVLSPSEPQIPLELQLESLFLASNTRIVTDMERIVIILCRVAHRIIRTDTLSEADYSVLLQIFELGLFLAQFKDRWLSHLQKTQALQNNEWAALEEFTAPGALFTPARELISFAQEYILRQNYLLGNRCDLCAYALANISGIYTPSLSLLLQRKNMVESPVESESEGQTEIEEHSRRWKLPLHHFYFLLYNLADSFNEKKRILIEWVKDRAENIDGTVLYLPFICTEEYFSSELKKIRNLDGAIEIVKAARSHRLLSNATIILHSHGRMKLSTRAFSEILISTYKKEEFEYTVKVLQTVSSYNPVAAESMTKSLLIMGRATELASYFFSSSFIIDKEYAEVCILCSEDFASIPRENLKALCDSDYFSLLCAEKQVFQRIVKTVAEVHNKETVTTSNGEVVTRKMWDILAFCKRIFSVQNITVGSLEKGLFLMLYFPSMSNTIKRIVWSEIEYKSMSEIKEAVDAILSAIGISASLKIKRENAESVPNMEIDKRKLNKSAEQELDHIIDVLNHYREIPAIQKQLVKLSRCNRIFPVLSHHTPDVFTIKFIRRQIKKLKTDIKALHAFLMELKDRNELHSDSYWFTQAKRKISLGCAITIRSLNSIIMQDDMLYLLSSEEDIVYLLRLVSKRPVPDALLASLLLEKLETESCSELGLVLGSTSAITATVPNKPLCIYLTFTQKEFTGRQSLVKVVESGTEIEVFIRDGILMYRSKTVIKNSNYSVEEKEGRVICPEACETDLLQSHISSKAGWSLSLCLSVTKKKCEIIIGQSAMSLPYGIKPASIIIGEDFKGILHRALILEESYKKDRLSSKPSEAYYIDTLVSVERSCQYYNKFGLLIDSTCPYIINGSSKVRMINTFKSIGSQWRVSERLCRYIAKLSAKHYQIEEVLHTNLFTGESLAKYRVN